MVLVLFTGSSGERWIKGRRNDGTLNYTGRDAEYRAEEAALCSGVC